MSVNLQNKENPVRQSGPNEIATQHRKHLAWIGASVCFCIAAGFAWALTVRLVEYFSHTQYSWDEVPVATEIPPDLVDEISIGRIRPEEIVAMKTAGNILESEGRSRIRDELKQFSQLMENRQRRLDNSSGPEVSNIIEGGQQVNREPERLPVVDLAGSRLPAVSDGSRNVTAGFVAPAQSAGMTDGNNGRFQPFRATTPEEIANAARNQLPENGTESTGPKFSPTFQHRSGDRLEKFLNSEPLATSKTNETRPARFAQPEEEQTGDAAIGTNQDLLDNLASGLEEIAAAIEARPHGISGSSVSGGTVERTVTAGSMGEPAASQISPEIPTLPRETARTEVSGDGDSFWTVAQRAYGDGRYFSALYQWNHDRHGIGDILPSGTIIECPPIEMLRVRYQSLVPRTESRHLPPAKTRTITTVAGDTLFGIARQYLGQASRFSEIGRLNSGTLGDSVGHLDPLPAGLQIHLPD